MRASTRAPYGRLFSALRGGWLEAGSRRRSLHGGGAIHGEEGLSESFSAALRARLEPVDDLLRQLLLCDDQGLPGRTGRRRARTCSAVSPTQANRLRGPNIS